MSRFAMLTVVGLVLVSGPVVRAERYITLSANFYGGGYTPPQGTFYIGMSQVGSSSVQELFVLSLDPSDANGNNNPNQPTQKMRDRAIPAEGIQGVCRRATFSMTSVNGLTYNAIQVFHPDSIQYWGSLDGTTWQPIVHGTAGNPNLVIGNIVGGNDPGQWVLIVGDVGSNPQVGSAAAPTVSTVGLTIMLAIGCVTAVYVFRRRA